MINHITVWKNGDYAVISNSLGTAINFFGTNKIYDGVLTLSDGTRAKSIHAIDVYQPDSSKPTEPMGLLIVLMNGTLAFIGDIAHFRAVFQLVTIVTTGNLHILQLPEACKVSEVGVFREYLVLITSDNQIFLNRSAAANCAAKPLPGEQHFLELSHPLSSANLIKSVAIGEKFLALLVEDYGVFIMIGCVAGSYAPDNILFTHKDTALIKFNTQGVDLGEVAKWMQVRFLENKQSSVIIQLIAHQRDILVRTNTGAVFSTHSTKQILGAGMTRLMTESSSALYYIQDNTLRSISVAGMKISPHSVADTIEMISMGDRADTEKLLLLKQHSDLRDSGYITRELVMMSPDGVVNFQKSFIPVFSNRMPIAACAQTHNRVAIWSNGACAVAIRDMIFAFGVGAEDQQQFGSAFDISIPNQYSRISKPDLSVNVSKIFAGEHTGGRALFVLTSTNVILARGALRAYNLKDSKGNDFVDTTYLMPIMLPRGLVGNITGIGFYQSAMIVLTENHIFLNAGARELYEISGVSDSAGFLGIRVPTLDAGIAKALTQSLNAEIDHEVKKEYLLAGTRITEQKIVLGKDSFYILMPEWYVIEYVKFVAPDIVEAGFKNKDFLPCERNASLSTGQIFRIINFLSKDRSVLIKDIQIPTPLAEGAPSFPQFLSTKGRVYGIRPLMSKLFMYKSFDKDAGLIAAIKSDKLVFVRVDDSMIELNQATHIAPPLPIIITGPGSPRVPSSSLIDSAIAGPHFAFVYRDQTKVNLLHSVCTSAAHAPEVQLAQVVDLAVEQFAPSLPGSPRSASPTLGVLNLTVDPCVSEA